MKTIFLSLGLLIGLNATAAENCSRTGSFVGAGDVDVTGSVTIERQSNGDLVLTLSNDFISDSGPDLDIYLGSTDRVTEFSIKVEPLSSLTGQQSYTLSPAIGIDDYEYVSIHCTQYNHYYGAAQLQAKTGDCSGSNSVEVKQAKSIELSAVSAGLLISSDQELSAALEVFDLTGKSLSSARNLQLTKGQNLISYPYEGSSVVVLNSPQGRITQLIYK